MYHRVRGTQDIVPPLSLLYAHIESAARSTFFLYGAQEIRIPVIEPAQLFLRGLGDTSEIVQKQMFIIERERETIALRPEGTAGVARAYIENGLSSAIGLGRFFYIGPMFRAERPQKGRLRQFHHIGCEFIGEASIYADLDIFLLIDALLKKIGLEDYVLRINSLGCTKDRAELADKIRNALFPVVQELCDDCKMRFERNPLRILDCKNKTCRQVVGKAVADLEFLCDGCKDEFNALQDGLHNVGISYIVDKMLVRGLDYYTKTVFELTHPAFVAGQDAIGAGGRYDGLIEGLGGRPTPAVGFALGLERVILALEGCKRADSLTPRDPIAAYVVYQQERFKADAFMIARRLRNMGVSAVFSADTKSMKAQLRHADRIGARFAIIIGEDEVTKDVVQIKDLSSGGQESVALDVLSADYFDKKQ